MIRLSEKEKKKLEKEEALEEALKEAAEGLDPENSPEEAAAGEKEEAGESGEPEASGESEKTGDSEKEGFFKKKKDKKVTELEEKVKELTDQRIRQMAEFENFRKRTDKEKSQMFDLGAKSVIEKILPVVDNFERGLASLPDEEKENPFADGMNKIYKQLMTELDNLGVKAIEAKGKEFNPELHNAVMQVESEELESGTVAEELQKGYTYHDIVVRHSMVSVVS
ncbi:MAG: nucleotide exchange factor GrpE [Lachnospiraceae bacterium]|nr:nucleotide exchange factor GrpE [Lachnospiraceae bacterium]